MEPLVDPLRVHTYGVKRPLEEKRQEIEDLYKNNKRYYPKDKRGELDEWGAVIKNQNEMFGRIAQQQIMDKKKNMEQYGKELTTESDNRVNEEKYNLNQEKQFDRVQSLNKQRESDMLNQQSMNTKKNIQSLLANDYENAMRLKQSQRDDERRHNLMAGQMSVNKAQHELDYLTKAENDKKRMIKQILTSEKNAYDTRKNMNNQTQIMDVEENKKLMAQSEFQHRNRDYQDSVKYNNFNKFQDKINQNYREHVFKPEHEKASKFRQIINKQEEEAKKRLDTDAHNRENAQRYWRMSNRAGIEKQIRDKMNGTKVGETEFNVDMRNRLQHETDVKDVEHFEKFTKKAEQNQYKDMLDTQVRGSKQRRMYGNMTGVEKSLNKDDLVAWKNYDHNTYALIPGLNSSKKPIPNKLLLDKNAHKRDRSYDEELHRMNQFGFTRDVTLARDPSYSEKMAKSSRKFPESQSVGPSRTQNGSRASHNRSHVEADYSNQQKVMTGESPSRSKLQSGHRMYKYHHLYSNYNPINGSFYQTENPHNTSVFSKAGTNMLL